MCCINTEQRNGSGPKKPLICMSTHYNGGVVAACSDISCNLIYLVSNNKREDTAIFNVACADNESMHMQHLQSLHHWFLARTVMENRAGKDLERAQTSHPPASCRDQLGWSDVCVILITDLFPDFPAVPTQTLPVYPYFNNS